MPIIRIKNKGLPKAQMYNSQITTTTTTMAPTAIDEDIPRLIFTSPAMPNAATDTLELSDEEKKEAANQQNYQNWLQKPQNEMSQSSWAQPFQQKFNLNPQYDASKKYDKKGNEIKPFDWNKFGRRMGRVGAWGTLGLNVAGAVTDHFVDRKKQKDWDKWFREQNLPDNMYAASPGDRGDFDINEGIYRPNQLTPPNVGAAVAQFGGAMIKDTDMNKIKIRIKSGPSNMAYGGQAQGMALGLDLGQKDVYRHMPKEKSEEIRGVIPEVPRSEANIEAEKGETVYGDLDGDGSLEHLKIGGKRHVDGGTPLNVPEGSFIFSDTKKMIIKDARILSEFGMPPRKGGYTPAEIAKKYDITKYKAVMEDPNVDDVRKSTAQLMIKNFQKKLAKLALVQEGMKGFPQGIPKVATDTMPELAMMQESMDQTQNFEQGEEQEMEDQDMAAQEEVAEEQQEEQPMMARYGGGLRKYQGATTGSTVYDNSNWGSVNPMFNTTTPQQTTPTPSAPVYTQAELQKMYPWYKPYTQSKTVAGRTTPTKKSSLFDPNIPSQYNDVDFWVKDAASKGIKINDTESLQRHIYNTLEKEDPSAVQDMWKEFGHTAKGTGLNVENFADAMAGARSAFLGSKRIDKTVTGFICTGRDANGQPQVQQNSYMSEEARTAAGAAATEAEAATQCPEVPQKGVSPGTLNINAARKKVPTGWMPPDIVNMAAASAIYPKKYLPYIAQAPFEPGKISLEDWRAMAAARQSMFNKAAETMGVYGPTTGQAANVSSAAGQQAEGLTGDIAGVTSRNVDRLNQWMQGERQRKDQFNLLGANRATELYKGNVVANQQYDNARRQYLNNIAKTYGQGWKNKMMLGMLNAVNPSFQVDYRTGSPYFTGGYGTNMLGSGSSSGAGDFASINKAYMQAKSQLPDLTLDKFLEMSGYGKSKSSSSQASQMPALYNMLMQGYSYGNGDGTLG